MARTIATMTTRELREVVAGAVEQKLMEILYDPDDGLQLRRTVRARLARQKRQTAQGERGESLAKVARELGLA